MNTKTFQNLRLSTLCQALLTRTVLATGLVVALAAGCSATPDPGTTNNVTDDTGEAEDTGKLDDAVDAIGEDSGTTDGTVGKDESTGDTPDTTTLTDAPDTSADDADAQPDVTPDIKPDVPKDVSAMEKLLCPEAKGNCALCSLCPAFPVCTLKALDSTELKTYANDCAAICALNATKWPEEVGEKLWPSACPACPSCTPADMKLTNDERCVTTNAGTTVTVDHLCEAACVPDVKLGVDGKTPVAKAGKCKLACTDPPPNGGGCTNKSAPICSSVDGNSYQNECQAQNCDKKGCFPIGTTALSTNCSAGKMTKECDGECYDKAETPNCAATCEPTCATKDEKLSNGLTVTKGKTFRSPCVAQASGYKTGDCTGISLTAADPCSASLYIQKPCCADVEYGIKYPVCASLPQEGKPDLFVTFVNKSELACFKKENPNWFAQYDAPCVCDCPAGTESTQVCGVDGITYPSACQAKCYNKAIPEFTYQPGPCP